MYIPHHQGRDIWPGRGEWELAQLLVSVQGLTREAEWVGQWQSDWHQQKMNKSPSLGKMEEIQHSHEPWRGKWVGEQGSEGREEKGEGKVGGREMGERENKWTPITKHTSNLIAHWFTLNLCHELGIWSATNLEDSCQVVPVWKGQSTKDKGHCTNPLYTVTFWKHIQSDPGNSTCPVSNSAMTHPTDQMSAVFETRKRVN